MFFSSICERVTPRLSHANAAVVLSAVKVSWVGYSFFIKFFSPERCCIIYVLGFKKFDFILQGI